MPEQSAGSRVLQLRIAGGDYDQIAETMVEAGFKLTREQCEVLVDEELAKLQPGNENTTQLDLARLDTMLTALWKKVREGDVKAIAEAGKNMDRRAALLERLTPESENDLDRVRRKREERLGDG